MGLFFRNRNRDSTQKKANCNTSSLPEPDSVSFNTSDTEFSTEIVDEIQKDDIACCSNNGVMFMNLHDMYKIVYTGELARKGAEKIYAAVGYGNNEQWEDAETLPMNKTAPGTFELLTFRKRPGNINVAFKDGADNWDNNLGQNYIFPDYADKGSQ